MGATVRRHGLWGTDALMASAHLAMLAPCPGARLWRQVLSDPALRKLEPEDLFRRAALARQAAMSTVAV